MCGANRFEIDGHAIGGGFCYCRDCQMVGEVCPRGWPCFIAGRAHDGRVAENLLDEDGAGRPGGADVLPRLRNASIRVE